MDSIVEIKKVGGKVQISVSINDLVKLAERHPECPIKVLDKEAFAEAYIEQLKEYAENNDVEQGCSHLEYLIDEIIQQVFVSGSDSVEEIELK